MAPEPSLEAVINPEPLLPLLAEDSKSKQPQVEQVLVQQLVPAVRPVQTVRSVQQSSASAVVTQPPASTTATAEPVTAPAVLLDPGLRCPLPVYPKMSRRQFEEGLVTLRFLVGKDGHVLQTEIARTSGHIRLDVAAQNALSKCRFQPAMLKGQATQSWTSIQYLWRLQ
jgi:protein TonB